MISGQWGICHTREILVVMSRYHWCISDQLCQWNIALVPTWKQFVGFFLILRSLNGVFTEILEQHLIKENSYWRSNAASRVRWGFVVRRRLWNLGNLPVPLAANSLGLISILGTLTLGKNFIIITYFQAIC